MNDIRIPVLIILVFAGFLSLFILFGSKKQQQQQYNLPHTFLAGATKPSKLTPEQEKKIEEKILAKLSKKVAGQADCTDYDFPYFNPETSTCVQCFESSFNCLTGFQRCLAGRCVKKNSPQCSYYPIGNLGGGVVNEDKSSSTTPPTSETGSKPQTFPPPSAPPTQIIPLMLTYSPPK